MRTLRYLLLASITLTACGGSDDPIGAFIAKTKTHRDTVCACKTAECADKAFEAWHEWDATEFEKLEKAGHEPSTSQTSTLIGLNTEMVKCQKDVGGH